jgi:hypothetical protein
LFYFWEELDKNERLIINFIKSLVFVPKDFLQDELKKCKYYLKKIKNNTFKFFADFKTTYMVFELGKMQFKNEFYAFDRFINSIPSKPIIQNAIPVH